LCFFGGGGLGFFFLTLFLCHTEMVQATFRTASSLVFTNWPDLYPGRKLLQFFFVFFLKK
jgi:hypothetical protein